MVHNHPLPYPTKLPSSLPYVSSSFSKRPLVSALGHDEGAPRFIPISQGSIQTRFSNISLYSFSVKARLGGGGGAGVLERPGLDQSQSSPEPSVEEGGEMGRLRQRLRSGGGDRYRVLLLDHERHTETQVAAVLPKVVPSVTPDEARKCFHESREKGAGLVTVTVKEHAEFYAQMMVRCGLRSSIEPDVDTL